MLFRNLFTPVIVLTSLIGCGSSSSDQSPASQTTPITAQPEQPAVIEDIFCNASYKLPVSTISADGNDLALPQLFDGFKTFDSSWQATDLDTDIIIELESPAQIKQLVITWANTEYAHLFNISASKDKQTWQLLDTVSQSEENTIIPDLIKLSLTESEAQTAVFLKLSLAGSQVSQPSEIIEIEAFGCAQDVNHDIELIDWYLSIPTDNDQNGKSDSIKETSLSDGYTDPRFFGLSQDAGITFTTSVSGYRTSTNTKYVRSELREMLRRGNTAHSTQGVNKNNWVFSTAPQQDLDNAGGVDGDLYAELAVNSVTTTGEDYQIGRVIIGQIHANDDEPARLYYRKLPNNEYGSIYLAHELLDGDDTYYEIIGSRANSATNPTNGIALNEKFSYRITVDGHDLTVTITKSDGTQFSQTVAMDNSGYDEGNQYMYFKAGVYNQNNSGDLYDYVQATFYTINNTHDGYPH